MDEEYHSLLFAVRRSVRYHTYRRRFFDAINSLTTFSSLMLGSGAIYALKQSRENLTIVLALITSGLSAVNLAFRTNEKARAHWDLAKRFIELEKKIVTSPQTEEQLRTLKVERLSIEADEPPIKRVLDSICHNEMLRSMGYPAGEFVQIRLYQRWLAQFFDVGLDKIKRPA